MNPILEHDELTQIAVSPYRADAGEHAQRGPGRHRHDPPQRSPPPGLHVDRSARPRLDQRPTDDRQQPNPVCSASAACTAWKSCGGANSGPSTRTTPKGSASAVPQERARRGRPRSTNGTRVRRCQGREHRQYGTATPMHPTSPRRPARARRPQTNPYITEHQAPPRTNRCRFLDPACPVTACRRDGKRPPRPRRRAARRSGSPDSRR